MSTYTKENAAEDLLRSSQVIIPSGVTLIEDSAFKDCTGLTSIVIPEGVTSIEGGAFWHCTGLTSVVIPEGVTSIEDGAFWYCTGLTSVVIPKGVTSIGNLAFQNCIGLTSVVIPEGVTSIGDWAFEDCTGLTSVVIPKGVTSIGILTFKNCTGLTSIVIPEGVTSIGDFAFQSCTGLTSVVIPKGVTSIGNAAFKGCTGLTSAIIPASVTSIGLGAFWNCTSLTSAVIPEGVTSIEDGAFRNCTGLTSLVIPESLTAINPSVINGCNQLQFVYAPDHLHDNLREFLPRGTQILGLNTHDLNQMSTLERHYALKLLQGDKMMSADFLSMKSYELRSFFNCLEKILSSLPSLLDSRESTSLELISAHLNNFYAPIKTGEIISSHNVLEQMTEKKEKNLRLALKIFSDCMTASLRKKYPKITSAIQKSRRSHTSFSDKSVSRKPEANRYQNSQSDAELHLLDENQQIAPSSPRAPEPTPLERISGTKDEIQQIAPPSPRAPEPTAPERISRTKDEIQQIAPPSPRTPEPTAPERISRTKIAVSTLTSASLLGIGITLIKYGALTGLAAPLLWPLAIGLTVLGGIALVGVMGISIRQCYRDHSVFKAKKAMNTDRLQEDLNETAFKTEENMRQTLFSPPPSESANQHQKITSIPIASLRAAFSAVYH